MRSASALQISSKSVSGAVYSSSGCSGTTRKKRGVAPKGIEMPVWGVGTLSSTSKALRRSNGSSPPGPEGRAHAQ